VRTPARPLETTALRRAILYDARAMQPQPPPPPKPPRVTLVLAICAVLGLVGSSFGLGLALTWNAPLVDLPPIELGPAPPELAEGWQQLDEALRPLPEALSQVLRERRATVHAFGAVHALASVVLLWGAIGARIRRHGGLAMLRVGLVLSQASALLGAVVFTSLQLAQFRAVRPLLLPLLSEGGQSRELALGMLVAQALAVAMTAALLLALLLFFVWVHRWTRRPAVQQALSPQPE